jgi:hypothetical protein
MRRSKRDRSYFRCDGVSFPNRRTFQNLWTAFQIMYSVALIPAEVLLPEEKLRVNLPYLLSRSRGSYFLLSMVQFGSAFNAALRAGTRHMADIRCGLQMCDFAAVLRQFFFKK